MHKTTLINVLSQFSDAQLQTGMRQLAMDFFHQRSLKSLGRPITQNPEEIKERYTYFLAEALDRNPCLSSDWLLFTEYCEFYKGSLGWGWKPLTRTQTVEELINHYGVSHPLADYVWEPAWTKDKIIEQFA